MGTLFERLPRAQIRSKSKNFCAHHQANNETVVLSTEKQKRSKISIWAQVMGVWKKVPPKVGQSPLKVEVKGVKLGKNEKVSVPIR